MKIKVKLSDTVKAYLVMFGYCGGVLVLTLGLYKIFATMVGKAVAKELLKAGIIAVAL